MNVDLLDGSLYAGDPYPTYRWLRDEAPAYWDERNGLWGISRYDDVVRVSREPETFSSAGGARPNVAPMPMMIDRDDPRHAQQRRLVNRGFTPRRIAQLEDHVRDIVVRMLDAARERGEFDLVADLARPLPMTLIGDMLGIPAGDHARVQDWSDAFVRGPDDGSTDTVMEAFAAFTAYHEGLAERARTDPGDDLVSIWTHAEIDGHRLSEEEILFEHALLLVGGNETTRNAIAGGVEQLLRHREQWHRLLDDPGMIPNAVEEVLRWTSPIVCMQRHVTRDADVAGAVLRAGDRLVLLYGSANSDERVFVDPGHFDVERSFERPHLAFGFGPHHCLGASLARLEIRVALEELTSRMPDLSLADPDLSPVLLPSTFVRGITSLPVACR